MQFAIDDTEVAVDLKDLIVAGWTGRDPQAVQHHIDELAELGIAPPSQIPLYYRVSNTLMTQSTKIDVLGTTSSGEVEPLLVHLRDELFLGLGSDHTDRELEAISVAASKQACPKPVAGRLWRFNDVAAHLDRLVLTCEIEEAGHWVSYQEGSLESIRPLRDIAGGVDLKAGQAMLCGTLGAIGGVRPASAYRMRLADPILNRNIELSYRVRALPVVA